MSSRRHTLVSKETKRDLKETPFVCSVHQCLPGGIRLLLHRSVVEDALRFSFGPPRRYERERARKRERERERETMLFCLFYTCDLYLSLYMRPYTCLPWLCCVRAAGHVAHHLQEKALICVLISVLICVPICRLCSVCATCHMAYHLQEQAPRQHRQNFLKRPLARDSCTSQTSSGLIFENFCQRTRTTRLTPRATG